MVLLHSIARVHFHPLQRKLLLPQLRAGCKNECHVVQRARSRLGIVRTHGYAMRSGERMRRSDSMCAKRERISRYFLGACCSRRCPRAALPRLRSLFDSNIQGNALRGFATESQPRDGPAHHDMPCPIQGRGSTCASSFSTLSSSPSRWKRALESSMTALMISPYMLDTPSFIFNIPLKAIFAPV